MKLEITAHFADYY